MSEPRHPPLSIAQAISEHFRSVDSAPVGYSMTRPSSIFNGFYVTFLTLSLLLLTLLNIACNIWALSPNYDLVFFYQRESIVRVPIRLFFVIFFATYSLYAYTNWARRRRLALLLIGRFLGLCMALDLGALALANYAGIETSILSLQLFAGFGALAIFPYTVLTQAQLPAPTASPPARTWPWPQYLTVISAFALAMVIALWLERRFAPEIEWLRVIGLLGGIGPGVFMVQLLYSFCFYIVGTLQNMRGRLGDFAPPLAILIPAHNEAHGITNTIAAIDVAAARYGGAVHAYVVDNCSRDTTVEVAQAALAAAKHITGDVLRCDQPGKAIALNYGLSLIKEDFVVRIDADTLIGPECLRLGMPHFLNPKVGSVGGLPLPEEGGGFWNHVRLIEVLLRHGFYQVALQGFGGILGVPGMFAIYRKNAVEEVGCITQGMNGEDTDIGLRLNLAGYTTVSDPRAAYRSETPEDYIHLREQRLRWFRSIYHIAAHNRDVLLNPHCVAGFLTLPFMLMSAARRAMLVPFILYTVLVLALFHDTFTQLYAGAALAMTLGVPLFVSVLICVLTRRWRALPLIPYYLVFRLLRSYLSLSAALTLVYPPLLRSPRKANKKKGQPRAESLAEPAPQG
jgi:cellulose synthase/poly-beta-1,6-N-acetylglucosamine synthase-like glycosyltransferase